VHGVVSHLMAKKSSKLFIHWGEDIRSSEIIDHFQGKFHTRVYIAFKNILAKWVLTEFLFLVRNNY
jgi:hypothetical protein